MAAAEGCRVKGKKVPEKRKILAQVFLVRGG